MQKLPCRVCLQTEISFVDILSIPLPTYEDNEQTLLEMFTEICEIAMQEGDNSILCTYCQKRLFEAYKFRREAQNAISLLEKISMEIVDEIKVEQEQILNFKEDTKPFIKEESSSGHNKVKLSPKTTMSPVELIMLNRFHCRFCLKYIKGQLKDHEQHHISKYLVSFH